MSDLWYSVQTPPPPLVQVRVQWAGRVFLAKLSYQSGVPAWFVFQGANRVYLPEKKNRKAWGDQPEAWQPQYPDQWAHELPEAMSSPASGRMVNIRARKRMSDEADATGDKSDDAGGQWWLDPLQVTYSEKGNISRREAEARIMRAILTDGVSAFKRGDVSGTAAALMEMGVMAHDEDTVIRDLAPRFEPRPRDQSDHLVAMTWFAALAPVEMRHKNREAGSLNQAQKLLVWRAINPPYSWGDIGDYIKANRSTVRYRFKESLEMIFRAANGQRVYKHVTTVDQVAITRAENRAFRSRA